MTWARRLKRVFNIEIERCARCAGRLRVIASIEEPALIARILAAAPPCTVRRYTRRQQKRPFIRAIHWALCRNLDLARERRLVALADQGLD
jgi:hypothetical protein